MYKTIVIIIILCVIAIIIYKNQSEKLQGINCENLEVFTIDYPLPGPTIGLLGSVHGNEPTGQVFLTKLVNGEYQLPKELQRGKFIVIPRPNICGFILNTRYQRKWFNRDLNRNFSENGPLDSKSAKILEAFKECDLIIDIHNGWGFYQINPPSVGSTLAATTSKTIQISQLATDEVNKTIQESKKKFVNLKYEDCNIPNTLSCYMRNSKRDYILIEISGQNNIQPIELCVNQARILVETILMNYIKDFLHKG